MSASREEVKHEPGPRRTDKHLKALWLDRPTSCHLQHTIKKWSVGPQTLYLKNAQQRSQGIPGVQVA